MSIARDPNFADGPGEPRAVRRPSRWPRSASPGADDELDRSLRPAAPRGLRQPGAGHRTARGLHRGGAAARRAARPRAARRPARARQDLARPHRRRRARGAAGPDRRPGARAQGRHRRLPDRARARQRLLHRRDPPPQPRDRGDALPGDGGPAAAGRPRPGRRRAHRDARPAAVHADRRHHARGPADDAALATASASRTASSTTTPTTSRGSSSARRGSSASRSSPRAPRAIAERSRGTPRVANRLLKRVRDFAEVRGGGVITERGRDRGARACSRSTRPGSTATTARSSTRSRSSSPAGPVGLSTLAAAVDEEQDTIEDVYEPYPAPAGPDQAHPARAA